MDKERKTAAERATQLEGQVADLTRRMQALAGVVPTRPEDAERQQVIDAFFELFPHMRMFADPKFTERLNGLMARGDDLASASDHVWEGLTRRTLDSIAQKFADETAVDVGDLTPRDRRELAALFFQMSHDDPENFRQRFEAEDPKLVDDFLTRLRTRYFEPARRVQAAGIVRGQPRVPNGGPGRPVVSAPPQIDYSNRDAVENAAVEYMKSRGHLQDA